MRRLAGGGAMEMVHLLWMARLGAVMQALFNLGNGLCYFIPAGGVLSPQAALFGVSALGGFAAFWDPCVRASLSISASECGEEQGKTMGGLAFVQCVIMLIAPLTWNGIFTLTVHINPAICFYLGCAISLAAILPSCFVHSAAMRG